jgi:cytoskeleton protein RodZ
METTQEMNESLGTYLKRAREARNVSIEQVAYATRISLKMLRALEEDEHVALPAPTFVRGYLQAYAKYVRIDTQDLLLRYQHHLATAPDAKRNAIRSHYLYVRERYQEKRRLVMVIVLFATMLSVAGAYFFLKSQRDKHKRLTHTAEQIQKAEEVRSGIPPLLATYPEEAYRDKAKDAAKAAATTAAPVPPASPAAAEKAPEKAPEKVAEKAPEKPAEKAAEKPAEKASATPPPAAASPASAEPAHPATAPAAAATPAPAKAEDGAKAYSLNLKAETDVWFRYQTDEDEIKDLTLRAGKSLNLKANKVIKIFSGNLGALKAKLNGKEMDSLSANSKSKSVILPESESGNYKLPLFPQFQSKPKTKKAEAAHTETAAPETSTPAADKPAGEAAPQ